MKSNEDASGVPAGESAPGSRAGQRGGVDGAANPTCALVTSCDVAFVEGASALLMSVRRLHPEVRRYCFVPPGQVAAIGERLGSLAQVRAFPRRIKGVPDDRLINVGRLFVVAPPEDVSVYMDADVVMCRPAPEWWRLQPGKVNAVPDSSRQVSDNVAGKDRDKFTRQYPEVATRKGFNAGVFGLAPREWPDLAERFEDALEAGGYAYSYIIDQPLLNAIIQPRVNWLPFGFNAHGLFDNHIPCDVRAVHFTSSPKPWMKTYPRHEPGYWYWLKYGTPRAGCVRLLAMAAWIAVCSPKRWAGRRFRIWRNAASNR